MAKMKLGELLETGWNALIADDPKKAAGDMVEDLRRRHQAEREHQELEAAGYDSGVIEAHGEPSDEPDSTEPPPPKSLCPPCSEGRHDDCSLAGCDCDCD